MAPNATPTAGASTAPDGSSTGGGYSGGSADPSTAGAGPADQGPDQGADQGAGQPSTGTGQADNSTDPGTSGGDLMAFLLFPAPESGGPLHICLERCRQLNRAMPVVCLRKAANDADHWASKQQRSLCTVVQMHSAVHDSLSYAAR